MVPFFNLRWILDVPYLVVPMFVLLMWSVLGLRRKHGFTATEQFLASVLGLQLFVFVVLQFLSAAVVCSILDYDFSLLWPAIVLVTISTVCELSACCSAVIAEAGVGCLPCSCSWFLY